jgi:hypothetical protein
VVVEGGGALVEAAGVPGIAQLQALKIEMMAELVAEGAEEGAEAGDVFADGSTHPDADEMSGGLVVAEEFRGGILAHAQRACGEDLDPAAGDFVKVGGRGEEGVTGPSVLAPSFMADSISAAICGSFPSEGSGMVLRRSLSRKRARFLRRGGASVSMTGLFLHEVGDDTNAGRGRPNQMPGESSTRLSWRNEVVEIGTRRVKCVCL